MTFFARPLLQSAAILLCSMVAGATLTSCNVFDARSDELRCSIDGDCNAPRACVSGFCVVPPGLLPDADPSAPDATRPDSSGPAFDAGPCSLIPLVDDFSDGVAAPLWTASATANVTITEAGGVLTFTSAALPQQPQTATYASVLRNYDMTNGAFAIEIPTMPDTASIANANLVIGAGGLSQLEFRQKTGSLTITLFDGGTNVLATLAYNAVMHRWWRAVGSGGMVLAQTSPDGVSWTTHGSAATPAFFNSVGVDLQMRVFNTGTIPGSLVFDNANTGVTCSE